MMKYFSAFAFFLLLIILQACGRDGMDNSQSEKQQAAGSHSHSGSEEEVHLLKKQMEVMDIRLGKLQDLNLSTTVKSSGRLELPPQNKADISSLLGGRVKEISVLEGDKVSIGQRLATLENADLIEIQESYLRDKSQYEMLAKDYERQKQLFENGAVSASNFQDIEADYLSAKASFEGSVEQLRLYGVDVQNVDQGKLSPFLTIRSPISGYIRNIGVNIGRFVIAQEKLFEVVDNDHIHIDLKVYEKDINKVKKDQKVVFSLSNFPDSVFEGRVFALGKALEEDSKAMMVHAEIDNYDGTLLPGMYVDARIVTTKELARSLPEASVVNDAGLEYIFVLLPDSEKDHGGEFVFRKIEVNTGARDMGFVEVVPAYNLPDHVEIVTQGAFYLLAEMKKGEGGEGHHH